MPEQTRRQENIETLERVFPWLAIEPDSEEWDEPSGADVIDQLQSWYDALVEDEFHASNTEGN